MLILGRKVGSKIWIGPDIVVTYIDQRKGMARLGIDAPNHVQIVREEAKTKIKKPKLPTDSVGKAVDK